MLAVAIYLDIVNLFLNLLTILQEVSGNNPTTGDVMRTVPLGTYSNAIAVDEPTDRVFYRAFPFVLFSSPDLRSIRRTMFTRRYTLMSHDLNVLDMLLSKPQPE